MTHEDIQNQMSVEVVLKKQSIIRGIYTAWNVTQISFALDSNAPMVTVLDDNIYGSDVDKRTGTKEGMQLHNRDIDNLKRQCYINRKLSYKLSICM